MAFLGVDIGSASFRTAWVARGGRPIKLTCLRHHGRPMETARDLLQGEIAKRPDPTNLAFTGS